MSATVIILAEYRERKARLECSFVCDPLALWRAWYDFWAGVR